MALTARKFALSGFDDIAMLKAFDPVRYNQHIYLIKLDFIVNHYNNFQPEKLKQKKLPRVSNGNKQQNNKNLNFKSACCVILNQTYWNDYTEAIYAVFLLMVKANEDPYTMEHCHI